MNLLKFIFFWTIFLIQGIVLFPIHLIGTFFLKKGRLLELARRRDLSRGCRQISQRIEGGVL